MRVCSVLRALATWALFIPACQQQAPLKQVVLMKGVPVPTQEGLYEPEHDLEIWTRSAVIFKGIDDPQPALSILDE